MTFRTDFIYHIRVSQNYLDCSCIFSSTKSTIKSMDIIYFLFRSFFSFVSFFFLVWFRFAWFFLVSFDFIEVTIPVYILHCFIFNDAFFRFIAEILDIRELWINEMDGWEQAARNIWSHKKMLYWKKLENSLKCY